MGQGMRLPAALDDVSAPPVPQLPQALTQADPLAMVQGVCLPAALAMDDAKAPTVLAALQDMRAPLSSLDQLLLLMADLPSFLC